MAKAKSARVLIVDDESSIVDVFARMLETMGYVPLVAPDAENAVRILKRKEVDVILLDNCLPGMMGMHAITEIPKYSSASIILMTGSPDEDRQQDALLLGAKGFLGKPVRYETLERAVRRALLG